jgi:hypothetical protein
MNQKARRRQPILIIEVLELDRYSSTIELILPGHDERLSVESSWGYKNLTEYYEYYYEGLEAFKQVLQGDSLDQDFETLTRAFKAIFITGKDLFESLFGANVPKIRNYLTKYRDYLAHQRLIGHGSSSPRPQIGIIEVRTKHIQDIIPIEGLVIVGSSPEVRRPRDMIRAASGILGFSFIINRVITRIRQSQIRELRNVPRLPLKYFCDKKLTGVDTELTFFRQHKQHFALDGPWPDRHTKYVGKELVQYLFQPDIGFGQIDNAERVERQWDEIHHLSCHCYTNEEHSWKYNLWLTDCPSITLQSMRAHLADLKYSGTESKTQIERPLVFLNACGGSKLTPKGMASFPEYFLQKNMSCGFIGCEIGVPDRFAAEFSKQFYLHLLRGFGVGEAIFMARHTMLARHKNPLGILYTSYVDPYLHISKAIDMP